MSAGRAGGGRPWLLPALVLAITAGTLLTGMATPRDLSVGEEAAELSQVGPLAQLLIRAFTGATLLLALAGGAVALLWRGLPRAGLGLWLSYLAFVALALVLPAFTGVEPGFDPRILVTPLVATAIYLARPVPPRRLEAWCKAALGAFVYAGLLGLVVAPAQVLATGYVGLIPGLDVRLYGVAGGSTSLGTQAAGLLALEAVAPSRSRWRWLHLLAAGTTLVLTQNKTSWLYVAGGAAWLGWRRLAARAPGAPARVGPGVAVGAALARGALGLAAAAALAAGLAGVVRGSDDAANLQNLTGRTYIWATSVQVWLEHPLLGYGAALWESEGFRARYGHFGHAHNQFLQALAGAGVVGLAALLAYLAAAWRASRHPAGAAPRALLLLLLWIALTDVPLYGRYLFDAFSLVHLLLFALLVNAARATGPPAAPAAAAAPAQRPAPATSA